jgi:hypothetical protein
MDTDPISTLLDSIAAGSGIPAGLYAPDAVLDAVVPMWRLEAHGPAAIAAQLSGWYADPGSFTELVRTPLPYGELVRYTLGWTENGAPMASHQVHVVAINDGLITRHEAWCGGRWDAGVQAEIEAGLLTAREAS